MKLTEGMWEGDLTDLVQPLISIDEYQSKIDNSSIALGFFVNDEDAAQDLNRFIQKSATPIIDCDTSPAPDQRGYYMVFVELLKNDRLVINIQSILEEISPLVGVDTWQMKIRGIENMVPYNGEVVLKQLKKNITIDKVREMKAQIEDMRTSIKSKTRPH